MPADPCPLCHPAQEQILYRDDTLRVIGVDAPGLPGYCRVIWNAHVAEMTFLVSAQRQRLMDVVWATEAAVRTVVRPHKVNLASLGNQVPHLHWHVIARFQDDAFFPDAIWAPPRRPLIERATPWQALADALRATLNDPPPSASHPPADIAG